MFQNNLRLLGTSFRTIVPNIPVRCITMPTSQKSYNIVQDKTPKFSRQIIKDLNEKPTPEQQRLIDEAKRVQENLQRKFELKQNDRNPANLIKVKVNVLNKFTSTEKNTETALSTETQTIEGITKPIILFKQPKIPKVLVQGIRRKIPVSMKKLLPLMGAIGGKHIFDAINMAMNDRRKCGRFVALALNQVKSHAMQREMDEERLYVSEAITGKHKRWKRLRYHAKGRGYLMEKNSSQVLIKLEEKPVQSMFKDVVVGKFPKVLAYFLRKAFLHKGGDYEVLRRNSYLLTAKGRQQRRLMFKRRVTQEVLAFREKGLNISRNIVAKKVLEEEALALANHYRTAKLQQTTQSLSDRQAQFKKNEDAIGL